MMIRLRFFDAKTILMAFAVIALSSCQDKASNRAVENASVVNIEKGVAPAVSVTENDPKIHTSVASIRAEAAKEVIASQSDEFEEEVTKEPEAQKADAPKQSAPKTETPKTEASKAEAPKQDPPKAEKVEPKPEVKPAAESSTE